MDLSSTIADKLLLSTSTVVLIITVVLVVVGALVVFMIYQNQQILKLKEEVRPKYGFLGKPILPVLIAAFLVGSFSLTYYVQQNNQNISVGNEAKVELVVKTEVLEVTPDSATVKFSLTPLVDNLEWGFKPGDSIEVYWNINGPKVVSEFEVGLNINKKGGFIKTLPRGDYQVTVNTLVLGKVRTKTVQMLL